MTRTLIVTVLIVLLTVLVAKKLNKPSEVQTVVVEKTVEVPKIVEKVVKVPQVVERVVEKPAVKTCRKPKTIIVEETVWE